MGNMVLNLLGRAASQALAPLNQLLGTIRQASDPVGLIDQMAPNDQRLQEVSNVIHQNGGLQQAFLAVAKQQGRDPNEVLKQAQQEMQNMFR